MERTGLQAGYGEVAGSRVNPGGGDGESVRTAIEGADKGRDRDVPLRRVLCRKLKRPINCMSSFQIYTVFTTFLSGNLYSPNY